VAWHGSASLRTEVLDHLDRLEARSEIEPVPVGDELLHVVDPPDSELLRVSLVTGWPADLLALCFEIFGEGLPDDPLGIRQMIQSSRTFLSVPRPGVDLRPLLPSFVVTRLTDEAWRDRCSSLIKDLLDRTACFLLGDDDPELSADSRAAADDHSERARERGSRAEREKIYYEGRALRWVGALLDRHNTPGQTRLLADVESFEVYAEPPPAGVPFPADYRAAEREHEASLQGLMLSMLAAAEADRCEYGCSRSSAVRETPSH
jgi:hypothetical protein